MYLKRVELHGFKSFAQRAVLEFGHGISAIVGPNGSGKSNIVDAIRWVLGEQNPRLLRGTRMEDVIFNGSEGRQAMGMAEVLLTLEDTGDQLPTEFHEVTIGRRVDRSGGSEYLLNQAPCRLKDIQELFYDTGIGREAYSIVGQGRVEEILSARSDQRRSLLEEAAGIVRFKVRKQEALRRLSQVEERLVRLGDILYELQSRLEPLRQAADKAREHRELSRRLEALELQILQMDYRRAGERWEKRRRAVEEFRQRLQAAEAAVEQGEAGLSALEQQLQELDEALEAGREAASRWHREMERAAAQQQIITERVENYRRRIRELEQRREELQQQLDRSQAEGTGDRARLEDLRRQRQELAQQQHELQEQLDDITRRVSDLETQLAGARAGAFAALDAMARAQNLQTRFEGQLAALDAREEQLAAQSTELQEQLAAAQAGYGRLLQEAVQHRERAGEIAGSIAQLENVISELQAERGQWQDRIREFQEQLARARSRVHALERLQQSYEGFFGGVRTVLRGRDRGEPAFAGVIGVMAELLVVEPQYEAALEAALGGGIQYLVTRTGEDAQRAIQHLRQIRGGRVTCLPLDGLRTDGGRERFDRLLSLPGIIGWADQLVSYEPLIEPAVRHLLGRVLVAKDLPSARRAARESGFRVRVVTLEGDVVHAGGAISGGDTGSRRAGLLNRQQDLERARAQVQQLEAELEQLSGRLAALESSLSEATATRERKKTELELARSAGSAAERDAAARRDTVSQLETRLEKLKDQMRQLKAERQKLQAQKDSHAHEVQLHAARHEEAQQNIARWEHELPVLKDEEARLQRALAAAAGSLQALAQQQESLEHWEERARRTREQLQQQLADCHQEREAAMAAMEAAEAELAQLGPALDHARQQHQQAMDHWQQLRQQREQQLAQLDEQQKLLRRLRRQADEQREALHRAEVDETKARLEVEEIRRRLWEQFGIDAPAAAGYNGADTGVTARDQKALQAEVSSLRRRLAAIGPVNPDAEREYAALRHRYDFLSSQTGDLKKAREDLHYLLEQMEEQMDDQFNETFERLRSCFQQVFRRLFGGGRADLVLQDDGDGPPGVEILAQPPGKRMQPLSLLSGGERSLTAIALLFSLLEIKPTPFCIVDEVDAALDENNLRRFTGYLQELSKRMQFIMITHQKQSMAIADTLYGVTLADNGSSRLVAVRLSDAVPGGVPS